MIQWTRVTVEETCGFCGQRIFVQQPAQLIVLTQLVKRKRQRFRCVECVGPAPPDLPEVVVVKEPEREPLRPLRTTAAQFTREKLSETDWTARILGERER